MRASNSLLGFVLSPGKRTGMTIELATREEQRRRAADVGIGIAMVLATFVLFYIDISEPRGVIDGIGYPAVIALAARFGSRILLGAAVVTTVLIVVAHFFLPPGGVGPAAEIGNRAFALATVWIVAELMQRRLRAEAQLAQRSAVQDRHQAALTRIVREALVADRPFIDRVRLVNEIASAAIGADLIGVFRFYEQGTFMRCTDMYQRDVKRHFVMMDVRTPDSPGYSRLLREDYVIAIDDLKTMYEFSTRTLMLESMNIRASLSIGVLSGSELTGQIVFAKFADPYHWTQQDRAFGLAVGHLLTTMFAAERSAETLAALDLVGEGIFTEDDRGIPVYANTAAIALAAPGRPDEPVAALKFPRPERPLTAALDQNLVRFGGRELEILRTRLPDGGIISRIHDVTEHNRTMRERDQLQDRLQQSAKMEAIGQLAGGVAHDFNNILGAIMGFAGFLAQDLPENSEQHHFAERILAASHRGKELVDQILTFARPKSAGVDSADLSRALRQTAELVEGSFPPSIALDLTPEAEGMHVACSASRLSQLLLNLCINARDAIGDRPGWIALRVARVPGSEPAALAGHDAPGEASIGQADTARDYARISVTDSGDGIEPEALKRIFEPFYTTKDRQRGTGLGLAVVHGVIESAGGFGHVRSTAGQGTEFMVYLPLADGTADNGADTGPHLDEPRGSERVLVVDDEPDIVDMMVIGLERLGYRAVGVSHPREALEAFEEDPDAFDIVVTDLVMPSIRGNELIRRIKAIRPGIRTILCTAFSDSTGFEHGGTAVADAGFRKPVTAQAIASCIRMLRASTVSNS
jgi:signal transduction histidine kinase